ncbi:MAG TPA: endonuclease III [Chitinophagaceae bacterium]|nr:endonuclease III [Chitinophagaceae bacterium]HNF72091.1 endonuclease III [Chitinophagaceae bacterium]
MKKAERYQAVIDYFQTHAPEAETELHFSSPYQLLVAVILSAQCTDKRVNATTPAFFERFPTVASLSVATFDEVLSVIKSISYPNAKSRHLIAMANMLLQDYQGEVPMDVKALMRLPGVGRKTANVITSVIDAQPNMAVDTHVFRVSARMGLTTGAKTPLQSEQQLIRYIPKELIHKAHHWLILHGRYVCLARNPRCHECGLTSVCRYFEQQLVAASKEKKLN